MERQSGAVSKVVVRIQAGALAVVCGTLMGVALFVMTAWLLLKGGPRVGPHLQLLGQYFPGYSVTWTGSVVGLFYGALTGGVIGWAIGSIYNRVLRFKNKLGA
jgi:hypothetical protein